jgi:GAF domain-containing protein
MDAATMGTWSMDFATRTCSISEGVGPIFGRPRGKGPANFEECLNAVHPEDREALTASLEQDWATPLPTQIEFRLLWPDGTVHWVEAHANIIRDASGQPVRKLGVLADTTKRKLDAISLQRANRALKTLSAGNAALVRARDESALLHSVCQVLVETGGYRLVAVAEALNDPNQTLKPVAWAGSEEGYFSRTFATWRDTSSEPLPVVRAVRSGTTQVSRNIASDPSYGSWKDAAVKRGFASNLALPLREGPQVFGVLSIYAAEPDAFDAEETRLLEELAGDLAYGIVALRTTAERDHIAHAHQHHDQILRKSLEDSVQAIAATVELRDAYTAGHQKRVAQIAVAIGKEMGLNADRLEGLHLAGVVHDLGKISVPAEILSKPGKLTPIEYSLVKGHAQAGYDILKDIDFPWPIATIVWQHHERADGSGYPLGLKGDEILLESRIMAVADVMESMASHRPYRPTRGLEVALQEIEHGRGTLYDAAVVDAGLTLFRARGFSLPDSAAGLQ